MNDIVEEVNTWLRSIGIDFSLFLAGAMGGFVKNSSVKKLPIWERILIVCSGAATATYLTPIIISIIGWKTEHTYGVAFLVGYLGLSIVEGLANVIHSKLNKEKENDK